jgi:phage terminase large subunit-like protein
VKRAYRRDRWSDQPEWIEVWSEKGTIRGGTLRPVLEEYGLTFRVMHGYGSSTALHQAAIESLADAERWNIGSIGMDRLFQGLSIANELTGAGMSVFPVGQGFTSMGPLWREFERLLLAGKVHHGGHPILRWAIQHLELAADAAGNHKPTRQNESAKIDPAVALLMTIDRHARRVAEPPTDSVYDTRGVLVF